MIEVYTALSAYDSVYCLREYSRLVQEIDNMKAISAKKVINIVAYRNHVRSKQLAEKHLKEVCNKYGFDYNVFLDTIEDMYTDLYEK